MKPCRKDLRFDVKKRREFIHITAQVTEYAREGCAREFD